jgi:hypothetical protein
MSITYSECVVIALVIQHVKRMRRVVLSSVTSPDLQHFSTLSHKRHDFQKKKLLNIKCVFWFFLQPSSKIYPILRRIQRDIIINVHRYSCKVPVVRFLCNLNFLDIFPKKHSNTKFHEKKSSESRVVPCVPTDTHTRARAPDEAASRFSKFCERA